MNRKISAAFYMSLLGPLVCVAIASPGLHAQELPKVPGATVTDLTPVPGFYTEPAIAINPRNPQQVVAAFQDNAHAGYSSDAGQHWQVATGVKSTRYRVSGDVSITYDTSGHAIICYMAFDKLGSFNYWGHNSSRNGLYVRRSLDGGKTWEAQDLPIIQQPNEPTVPWEDKPYIVADTTHSRFAGNLYVGWTRWTIKDSEIQFTRSTDDGKTWSKPIEIDKHPGLPRDDNGALEGFAGTVGPDGTLYVVWAADNQLQFTTSRDGGKTFATPRNIIKTAPIMFQVQSVARSNGFPQIAIDPRPNADGARLYITWSDYRNGDVDVFSSSSVNGGRTWGPAVRVNNDPVHDGADQFFQWLAVDPTNGAVNVMFYDRRQDPTNRAQIVVLARSTDAGRSFTNYAWTNTPFDDRDAFLGDYTGLTALNNRVYGIWTSKSPTDTRRQSIIQIGSADFGAAQK